MNDHRAVLVLRGYVKMCYPVKVYKARSLNADVVGVVFLFSNYHRATITSNKLSMVLKIMSTRPVINPAHVQMPALHQKSETHIPYDSAKIKRRVTI